MASINSNYQKPYEYKAIVDFLIILKKKHFFFANTIIYVSYVFKIIYIQKRSQVGTFLFYNKTLKYLNGKILEGKSTNKFNWYLL